MQQGNGAEGDQELGRQHSAHPCELHTGTNCGSMHDKAGAPSCFFVTNPRQPNHCRGYGFLYKCRLVRGLSCAATVW